MNGHTIGVRRVAVVGSGVMGRGVAQCLAQSGLQVVLVDSNPDALDSARSAIRQGIRLFHVVRPGRSPQNVERAMGRITFTTELTVGEVDMVVENIPESWSAKEPLYRALDLACPPHCIFAANTSAIPIARISSATRRAPLVVGIHFMNPVPLKDAVEVIRGPDTSTHAVETALHLLRTIGKSGIVVNDGAGFVSNRILMLTINEAFHTVRDRVASAEDVDRIFRDCLGHAMGPLETADLIGLDTVLATLRVLFEHFGNEKFRPCPLLEELVAAGRHGRKVSRGLYTYA